MNTDRDLPADAYRIVFRLLPSPCLLLAVDEAYTILDANDAFLRETISDREDLIGRPVFDAFPDNPADQKTKATTVLGESLKRVVRLRRTDAMALQRYDVPDRSSDTGAFIVRYWSPINIPLRKPDGSVAFIIHRVENVTDFVAEVHKRTKATDDTHHSFDTRHVDSESELIRRSRQLSNSNQELRRLSEEALALAARLKDESIRKDEFLAMLGHELRNPLAGLASAFQLIDMSDAAQGVPQEMGSLINRQIGTLTRLVDDLLDASRVSRGAIRLHREIIDLRMVIETAAYSVRKEFEAKEHSLVIDLAPGDYTMNGDATRLQQVVANLLSNAVKFTDRGGIIRMRLSASAANEERRAVLTVEDNGRGIPARYIESIFELFAQVNTTLDRAEGGLGIGLNLARRLVELHGGTLVAKSEGEGKGSQFTVDLPLSIATDEQPAPVSEQPFYLGDRDVSVLLVEDNDDVRAATAAMLESFGYAVATASDGTSGVESMVARTPMVAIVDIGLPGIDGFEVARRARDTLGDKRPHLIALSGYSGPEVNERAIQSGFDDVFVKPIDIGSLQRSIQAVVAKAQANEMQEPAA
ncbi:ATP-binding protein [Caballeronia sp. LZ062]|uniref:hybrid sensor histidine kinase/response regulator n=1 Tax=unclassified Caballeronia TaxID=2646786 RepID=UPI0028666F74|nr:MULTISPECIES: ATP-binding protein [unclassified Caballeronia]MDR5857724.1 ATP-binding protein [Caballeronia sp. LZ050]MDR5869274.1 ATP-binding protein [Caballeronia sp. LZ062]